MDQNWSPKWRCYIILIQYFIITVLIITKSGYNMNGSNTGLTELVSKQDAV